MIIIIVYLNRQKKVLKFSHSNIVSDKKKKKTSSSKKIDEGFNDLPADTLPPNCQQILSWNGTKVPVDDKEILSSD